MAIGSITHTGAAARAPRGFLRRFVPMAATVIAIWLRWRWLRLLRRIRRNELAEHTARFHERAATAMVHRAVRQQGLIIKSCQFLSGRADILREEYVRILSLLQDTVPPRPWSEMRALIEYELGGSVAELYAEFDPKPIAAASLSQVYRARLHDGFTVAVKVQYPDIGPIVETDLRTLRFLSAIWTRIESMFDFRPLVAELERNAPEELDFIHEGHAAEGIAELFAERDDVEVPVIHWGLSTRRVLTMGYLDGIKITNIHALESAGIHPPEVSAILTDLYNNMILRYGFFHADPHPGNLLVLPAHGGRRWRVGLVDFGLTKRLDERFRQEMIVLTSAIISQRPELVSVSMQGMGFRTREHDDQTYYELGEAFLGEVLRSGRPYADQELFAEINVRLSRVLRANPLIDVPSDVVLVARVMGLLSGLGRALNSETDLLESLVPFLEEESLRAAS